MLKRNMVAGESTSTSPAVSTPPAVPTTFESKGPAAKEFADFVKAATLYAVAASDPRRVRTENLFPVGSEIFNLHLGMIEALNAWKATKSK